MHVLHCNNGEIVMAMMMLDIGLRAPTQDSWPSSRIRTYHALDLLEDLLQHQHVDMGGVLQLFAQVRLCAAHGASQIRESTRLPVVREHPGAEFFSGWVMGAHSARDRAER
jgi:hypothetical protein